LEHVSIGLGEGLVGWAAKTREATIVYDSKKDAHLRQDPGVVQFLRSLMVIPLVADNEIVGVMVVGKKEPAGFSDKQLQILSILGSQAAVATAKALLYKKIEAMAITDGLTGLYNHRYFYQRIEEEWLRAQRYKKTFAIILLDIDFFKKFNDTYGHKAGDAALVSLGKVLMETARNVDVVARYGGEEFAVVLPETSGEQAMIIAERMRRNIKDQPFEVDPRKPLVSITVSIGVASFPQDGETFGALIEAADQALYKAKDNGKNIVCPYSAIKLDKPL
jgi:diguanylate cyclase (GGDEF)-like protein